MKKYTVEIVRDGKNRVVATTYDKNLAYAIAAEWSYYGVVAIVL